MRCSLICRGKFVGLLLVSLPSGGVLFRNLIRLCLLLGRHCPCFGLCLFVIVLLFAFLFVIVCSGRSKNPTKESGDGRK